MFKINRLYDSNGMSVKLLAMLAIIVRLAQANII